MTTALLTTSSPSQKFFSLYRTLLSQYKTPTLRVFYCCRLTFFIRKSLQLESSLGQEAHLPVWTAKGESIGRRLRFGVQSAYTGYTEYRATEDRRQCTVTINSTWYIIVSGFWFLIVFLQKWSRYRTVPVTVITLING